MKNEQIKNIILLATVEGELTGMARAVEVTEGDVVWKNLIEALQENAEKVRAVREALMQQ